MMRVLGYLLLPGLALGSHCEGSTVPGYCCSIGCDTAIDLTQYGMTQPTCSTGDATLADIFAVASADNCDPLTEGSCAWDSSADAKCVSQGLCPAAVPPATMGCVPGVLAGAPSPPDSSRFYSMSSTRCARAFVSSPLYTALGLPDPSYPDLPARTFMECSKACAMDEKCDWFIYSPDEDADQPCVMYKDAYPFGYYSTIAEMVWSKGGGDPNCVLTDTYLGQPIFGGNTRCPLEEDVGNGCTNFAVADCSVGHTSPKFDRHAGHPVSSYGECLSVCANDEDNTYMVLLQQPAPEEEEPSKTCLCFTEFSYTCSREVSRPPVSNDTYTKCIDPNGSDLPGADLPGDYPPSSPAPPSSPPIGACGEGTYLDESGTCKIAPAICPAELPDDRRFKEKAQQETSTLSSNQCARAFVKNPPMFLPDNEAGGRMYPSSDPPPSTFMECAALCQLVFPPWYKGHCDWFTYTDDDFHRCRMFTNDVPPPHYWDPDDSTTAEMVRSNSGLSLPIEAAVGQPIFDGDTPCPLEDVGDGCTNFAVAGCSVGHTSPEYNLATGNPVVSYEECLSVCAGDEDNTYMVFHQQVDGSSTCLCFTEFSHTCSMEVSGPINDLDTYDDTYRNCMDPNGSDLPGDYPPPPPSPPAPPSSLPIGACGEGTYRDGGTCKIVCPADRRLEVKASRALAPPTNGASEGRRLAGRGRALELSSCQQDTRDQVCGTPSPFPPSAPYPPTVPNYPADYTAGATITVTVDVSGSCDDIDASTLATKLGAQIGVPPDKVKIVCAGKDTSRRRRLDSSSTLTVTVETTTDNQAAVTTDVQDGFADASTASLTLGLGVTSTPDVTIGGGVDKDPHLVFPHGLPRATRHILQLLLRA